MILRPQVKIPSTVLIRPFSINDLIRFEKYVDGIKCPCAACNTCNKLFLEPWITVEMINVKGVWLHKLITVLSVMGCSPGCPVQLSFH